MLHKFFNKLSLIHYLCFGLFLFFIIQKICIYYGFHIGFADLYYFDNSVWNLIHGNGLFLSYFNKSYFADHFYPYLYLLAPLYIIKPTPLWNYLFHAMILTAMTYPILDIAKHRFGKKGMIFTLILLIGTYTFRRQNMQDLHGDILMASFLAWIIHSFYFSNDKRAFLLTLLLPFAKENFIIVSFFIGLYFIFVRKNMKMGVIILSYSIVFFLFLIKLFIPHFNTSDYRHLARYSYLGNALSEQVRTIIFKPYILLLELLNAYKIAYVLLIFLPIIFLPLFSPYILLSIGVFAQNLLAITKTTCDLSTHYQAPLIPILAIASIDGLYRLKIKLPTLSYQRLTKTFKKVAIFFLIINLFAFIFLDLRTLIITKHILSANSVLKLIPKEASVSASDHFFIKLNHRDYIYQFPGIIDADYIVFEDIEPTIPVNVNQIKYAKKLWNTGNKIKLLKYLVVGEYGTGNKNRYSKKVGNLLANPIFEVLFNENDVYLLKKKKRL
ncbi:MAG: hypothetical protein A2Y40_09310 [Candidatus Margulisbacteria bacterium GWF2_35_9]|nr:MAG: hypothetical protein A2Y40_09310 [Candidatus Margulisbacteria bacterium GWF2_35_9]